MGETLETPELQGDPYAHVAWKNCSPSSEDGALNPAKPWGQGCQLSWKQPPLSGLFLPDQEELNSLLHYASVWISKMHVHV